MSAFVDTLPSSDARASRVRPQSPREKPDCDDDALGVPFLKAAELQCVATVTGGAYFGGAAGGLDVPELSSRLEFIRYEVDAQEDIDEIDARRG